MDLTVADFGSNMYFQKINPYFIRVANRMHADENKTGGMDEWLTRIEKCREHKIKKRILQKKILEEKLELERTKERARRKQEKNYELQAALNMVESNNAKGEAINLEEEEIDAAIKAKTSSQRDEKKKSKKEKRGSDASN